MNVLFMISSAPYFTNAVLDYDNAFRKHSQHTLTDFDVHNPDWTTDFRRHDAMLFSYSFFSTIDRPLECIEKFRDFEGVKVAIFQDEYTYFLRNRQNLMNMGVDGIITCVPQPHWSDVFTGPFASIPLMEAFTGYVNESFLHHPPPLPMSERRWKIGYRGRQVPYRYGNLTMEKFFIGLVMGKICRKRNIACNIDVTNTSRIYGPAWSEFIRNCRTMLITESGSNVFDFTGDRVAALEYFLAANPTTSYREAHKRFLADIDDKIFMNQVSPKVFETIAFGTGLIGFEGKYSGVIEPYKHFIPLKKDYSNADEVLALVEDTDFLEDMRQRAYADIITSRRYMFADYVYKVDNMLNTLQPCAQKRSLRVAAWN